MDFAITFFLERGGIILSFPAFHLLLDLPSELVSDEELLMITKNYFNLYLHLYFFKVYNMYRFDSNSSFPIMICGMILELVQSLAVFCSEADQSTSHKGLFVSCLHKSYEC